MLTVSPVSDSGVDGHTNWALVSQLRQRFRRVLIISCSWYGWSAEAATHCTLACRCSGFSAHSNLTGIVPILGTAVYAFGQMMTFLPIQLYLVDTFTYAASAVAAATVRFLFAYLGRLAYTFFCSVFPLHVRLRVPSVRPGDVRHARDGRRPVVASGCVLFYSESCPSQTDCLRSTGLSIVLGIPFPIFLWFKGESIRAKSRFAKASVKAYLRKERQFSRVAGLSQRSSLRWNLVNCTYRRQSSASASQRKGEQDRTYLLPDYVAVSDVSLPDYLG